jgi:hypothetical protein
VLSTGTPYIGKSNVQTPPEFKLLVSSIPLDPSYHWTTSQFVAGASSWTYSIIAWEFFFIFSLIFKNIGGIANLAPKLSRHAQIGP